MQFRPKLCQMGKPVGAVWDHLGATLEQVGAKLSQVRAKLIDFRTKLEPSWAKLGLVVAMSGPGWSKLAQSWANLGQLGTTEDNQGRLGITFKAAHQQVAVWWRGVRTLTTIGRSKG